RSTASGPARALSSSWARSARTGVGGGGTVPSWPRGATAAGPAPGPPPRRRSTGSTSGVGDDELDLEAVGVLEVGDLGAGGELVAAGGAQLGPAVVGGG